MIHFVAGFFTAEDFMQNLDRFQAEEVAAIANDKLAKIQDKRIEKSRCALTDDFMQNLDRFQAEEVAAIANDKLAKIQDKRIEKLRCALNGTFGV